VNQLPIAGGPLTSLDDDSVESKVVPAARTQLATSRQQLLATMVLMGINRIVVTDGRISAKVMFDFQARDNFKYKQSATRFDYDKTLKKISSQANVEHKDEGWSDSSHYNKDTGGYDRDRSRGGSYAKGEYKYDEQPMLTLASASSTSIDASVQTKAQLMGSVEVNFKSDYLPLEKMADSFQIGRIQDAAKPASTAPGARGVAAAPPAAAPAPAPSPAPAAGERRAPCPTRARPPPGPTALPSRPCAPRCAPSWSSRGGSAAWTPRSSAGWRGPWCGWPRTWPTPTGWRPRSSPPRTAACCRARRRTKTRSRPPSGG
jgi:hypothetical protein